MKPHVEGPDFERMAEERGMTDIVKRLLAQYELSVYELSVQHGVNAVLSKDAADEIERLRAIIRDREGEIAFLKAED